jgi:hypothetical protein
MKADLGLEAPEGFLVMTVKPFSPATTPMAYTCQLAMYSWHYCASEVEIVYLVVDEAGVLAGVLVVKVQGVAGELDTAILLALDEEAVVVA